MNDKDKNCGLTAALSSLLAGLVFGLGLIAAGMTDPMKVRAFLDLAGAWDPSLALVMGAAIAVGLPATFGGLCSRPGGRIQTPFQACIEGARRAAGIIPADLPRCSRCPTCLPTSTRNNTPPSPCRRSMR